METIDRMIKRCEQETITKNILALMDTQGWSVEKCLVRLQIEANEWSFYRRAVSQGERKKDI